MVSWTGAKGKQKNETYGARCGPGLLWSSCSEALHRRKGNKGGSRDAQQIETIAGSGSLPTHTDVLHAGSDTASTSSWALLVDLAPDVQCVQTALQRSTVRLGCQVAHRVGGASRSCKLSQEVLTMWHCGHTTGAWYDICKLVRPDDSITVGAFEDRAIC